MEEQLKEIRKEREFLVSRACARDAEHERIEKAAKAAIAAHDQQRMEAELANLRQLQKEAEYDNRQLVKLREQLDRLGE